MSNLFSLVLLTTSLATPLPRETVGSRATLELVIEAEDAILEGVSVDTVRSGYSGSGYVTGIDAPGDLITFTFTTEPGVYNILFATYQTVRFEEYSLVLDGTQIDGTFIGTNASFIERSTGERYLGSGQHSLSIYAEVDIDYLKLSPAYYDAPTAPATSLSDPLASPTTRAQYQFLRGLYGHQILSSQQNLSDIEYIASVTGRTPAIGAFDLIEYSPSRRQYGSNPGSSSENWISWAGTDALVSLMWHWNAPTDLINSQAQPWWRGFYTEAVTFDFAAALSDTSSENYKLLLRDIDAIAVQLGKFEAADLPVLWRPLHEAAGTWFWWGSKGPDAFKELWLLLYDRLVGYHRLHNLIWVYTDQPNSSDWYPGDDYVDIVSRDVYANSQSATMLSDWKDLQTLYGSRMLATLSESGTLPDPEVITAFGIWWSWFAVWNGNFIRNIEHDYLTRVFQSEVVMTRDELPNWRATVAVEPDARETAAAIEVYPNPSSGAISIRSVLRTPGPVRLEVFDVLGRRVLVREPGFQLSGPFEMSVGDILPSGNYFVRFTNGEFTCYSRFSIAR